VNEKDGMEQGRLKQNSSTEGREWCQMEEESRITTIAAMGQRSLQAREAHPVLSDQRPREKEHTVAWQVAQIEPGVADLGHGEG
jgi:hypothetical protein